MTEAPEPEKLHDRPTGRSQRLACPNCRVVQEVKVSEVAYAISGTDEIYKEKYFSSECYVCSYDGEWEE